MFAVLLGMLTPGDAQNARVRTLIELTLNGQSLGATLLLREGTAWYASDEDIATWRLQPRETRTISFAGHNWNLLNDLPGAQFQFDEGEQRLGIELAVSAFEGSRLDALAGLSGAKLELSQGRGGFVNYALFADQTSDSRNLSGFFNGTVFSPSATLTTSVAGLNLLGAVQERSRQFVRIESQWRRDDLPNATTLVLGDALSGSGLIGRSTRFAGLQWGTNFALRPGFVKLERPSLMGEATTQSVVELFVDGQLRGRSQVAPGPFEIPPISFINGRGEATLVVRDIFGRQQVITQPFYATSTLLRAGVTEHSFEAGAVRRAFGMESWRYGTVFASGLIRHGWRPDMTTELKLEASRDQALAGGALTALLPFSVLATVGGAVSEGERAKGALSLFNLDAGVPKHLNFNFNLQRTHGDFRQPAVESETPFPRYQANTMLSAPLGAFGSLAFNAISLNTESQPVRIRSLSYSSTLVERMTLMLSASRTETVGKSNSFSALLLLPFGERGIATAHKSRDGASESLTSRLQSSAPLEGGYGYRLAVNRVNAAAESYAAGVSARFAALQGSLDMSVDRHRTNIRADVLGALVHMDGSWHPSHSVVDGFALVRAPGAADVPVLVNGVPVGRTGQDGDFVATSIFAYSSARISLGTEELPMETAVFPNEQKVATAFRSGALAAFRVVRDEGLLLLVKMPDGSPLATGASIRTEDHTEEALVGYDGKAFFTKLRLPARMVAEYELVEHNAPMKKRCTFEVAQMPVEQRALAVTHGQAVTCLLQ